MLQKWINPAANEQARFAVFHAALSSPKRALALGISKLFRAPGSARMEATVKQLRARGNEEFAKGNFEQACKLYSQCAETITGNTGSNSKELKQELVLALSNRAQASLKLGDFRTALRDADAALECDELHVKATFRKARALHGLGEHEAAVGCLQKLLFANKDELPELQQEALKLLPPARMRVAHFMFLAIAERFNLVEVNPKCLGSGLGGQPLLVPLCTNGRCGKRASEAVVCKRCSLVGYCSLECKSQHHREHVKLCGKLGPSPKANLGKSDDIRSIFLWGNVPGISSIAPGQQNTGSDLNFCFAASGDLRDLLITMSDLPMGYSGKVRVLVNDFNSQVAVRNYVILELLRRYGRDAVECAIALWYSDAMSEEQNGACLAAGWDALRRSGYLERSAATVAACGVLSAQRGPPMEASFKGGMSSLSASFDDRTWGLLYAYLSEDLQGPQDVTKTRLERCMRTFKGWLGCVPEPLQPAWWQFHVQSGLMLPFSSINCSSLSAANKFLVDPKEREWSQTAVADPLHGWSFKDIESAVREFGLPSSDWYGGLFFHLRKLLVRFVDVLENTRVEIKVFCQDARLLADQLKKADQSKFHAIATSNIADSNYVGLERVLTDWGPLLAANGTLVTMQMNWAFSQKQLAGQGACVYDERYRRLLFKAFGVPAGTNAGKLVRAALKKRDMCITLTTNAPDLCIGWCRRSDVVYNKHLEGEGAHRVAARVGLEARPSHKLVPARIGVPLDAPPQAALVEYFSCAEEIQFNVLRMQPFLERYVEWTTKAA